VTVEISSDDQLYAQGAQVAVEVVDLLLHNTRANVAEPAATVRVFQSGDRVAIEVQDEGEALATDLREGAFTLEGQRALKGRSDGRYSRFVGLFAAAVVLDGVGGSIEADGESGAAIFRILLKGARPTRPPQP
jgi:nitrogen-specific signal transduction histidine kinase